MSIPAPYFLLTTESDNRTTEGGWRFVLKSADGLRQLEVQDEEPAVRGQRLELLAIVRGLEAIDQPSDVMLLTSSQYVSRGLDYGLDEWRANHWRWEHHGRMVPVKDSDLWRRVDRAMQIHRVRCCVHRIDQPHTEQSDAIPQQAPAATQPQSPAPQEAARTWRKRRRLFALWKRWPREAFAGLRLRLAQFGTGFLPRPWLD